MQRKEISPHNGYAPCVGKECNSNKMPTLLGKFYVLSKTNI